jgi:hypothetical protein
MSDWDRLEEAYERLDEDVRFRETTALLESRDNNNWSTIAEIMANLEEKYEN